MIVPLHVILHMLGGEGGGKQPPPFYDRKSFHVLCGAAMCTVSVPTRCSWMTSTQRLVHAVPHGSVQKSWCETDCMLPHPWTKTEFETLMLYHCKNYRRRFSSEWRATNTVFLKHKGNLGRLSLIMRGASWHRRRTSLLLIP